MEKPRQLCVCVWAYVGVCVCMVEVNTTVDSR